MSPTNMMASDLVCRTCPKCGEAIEHIVVMLGAKKKVPVACQCAVSEYRERQLRQANMDKLRKLDSLKRLSLMDESAKRCTFEAWQMNQNNRGLYEIGINYCKNWQEMKRENVGMMLHGAPGIGKSYLSFCIANELLKQLVPVIAISSIGLINKIYDSYKTYGEDGEAQIIQQLNMASLLILDDLGAEHEGKTGKEKQIIYSLLDARVRAQLPTIITTNLTPEQLKVKLTGNDEVARAYDRIVEACPQIKVNGTSQRVEKARHKLEILKGLVS